MGIDDLTLITEEKEYEPETTKPGWPKTEEEWRKVEEERIAWEKAEKLAEEHPETTVGSNPGPLTSNPKGLVKLAMVRLRETDEYKVKWIENGVFSEAKSYYTNDWEDAVATSIAMAAEAKKAGFDVLRSDPELLRPEPSNSNETIAGSMSEPGEPTGESNPGEYTWQIINHAVGEKHESLVSYKDRTYTLSSAFNFIEDELKVGHPRPTERGYEIKIIDGKGEVVYTEWYIPSWIKYGSNPSEPTGSNFHSLMLHAVADMYGPGGIPVDEAKAMATPCACTEYKPDKFWCTSPGVVGALTDEQEKIYCNPREIIERPGIKERMIKWAESVEFCRAQLPPTDGRTRLDMYITCMSKKLKEAGIESPERLITHQRGK